MDVTHDDMINLLIGHANVGLPMTPDQVSHHNQVPSHNQVNPRLSSQHLLASQLREHNHVNAHLSTQNQVSRLGLHNQVVASQNQVTSHNHVTSHNQMDLSSHNQVSPRLGSHNHVVAPQIQLTSHNQLDLRQQNQVTPQVNSHNQVVMPQNHVTSHNQIDSQAQLSSQNQFGSQQSQLPSRHELIPPNHLTSQHRLTSPNQLTPQHRLTSSNQLTPEHRQTSPNQLPHQHQPTSQNQLTPPHSLTSPNQVTSHHQQTSTNQQTSQNQSSSQHRAENMLDYEPQIPLQIPLQQMHNQYACPGCRKSILYTNRSSLVQLLSLHQQKCSGTQDFRYMCLECHSAFKTVKKLQDHEDTCPSSLQGSQFVNQGTKQKCINSTNTGGVIHSIPERPVYGHAQDIYGTEYKYQDGSTKDQDGGCGQTEHVTKSENLVDVDVERKIMVRESWTQTVDQSGEDGNEFVEILLDEISPAGRKRRMCARKMKVYNEKQMADQREDAEIERMKVVAGRKSARACKKDLKRYVKGQKMKKKGLDVISPPDEQVVAKPLKIKKVQRKPDPKEQDLEVPLQCQLCPKTFARYSVYTKHYQLHHERAMCQYCGVQCVRKKLKQHEKSHLKVFKCPYAGCTRVLNSKHRLKRHSRVHTGEKPYNCEVCAKPFAGKENMVKHKKRVHDKERKYQCRYCGQKFADKGGLKYHENTHTKQRPTDYRCKYCGRGYKSHVGCYLHERTHTGNMYKCSFCGKEFMAKVHLRKHEYIHTGNYPFRCGNCQKGFPNNGMMKKHKCLAVL